MINNSWGGGANSAAINAALTWGTTQGREGRGVNFLFATGNGYGAVSQPAFNQPNIPGVIAVGATNNRGTRSDYSNFGPTVDVVAPSNDLRTGYLAIDTTDRVGADGYDPSDYTGTGPMALVYIISYPPGLRYNGIGDSSRGKSGREHDAGRTARLHSQQHGSDWWSRLRYQHW